VDGGLAALIVCTMALIDVYVNVKYDLDIT